jgi:hypothetical protein
LQQFRAGGLPLLYYEDLCLHPEREVPQLLANLGLPPDHAVAGALERPSATTTASSGVLSRRHALHHWRETLGTQRIDNVLRVVEAFGLGDLYDSAGLPAHAPDARDQ